MASSNELTKCVLLHCDKTLENETERFATTLRSKCGHLLLETLESLILKAKGKDQEQKLDNVINKYADKVIIVCSPILFQFIDKKSIENITDFFKANEKLCRKHLLELLKKDSKKRGKLVLISFNVIQAFSKEVQQTSVITKGDDDSLFINRVLSEIIKIK
nr:uncharacterized protein LOC124813679 [Hydra vulgaris]XP_047137011.1 uncharacterized protein LOC124813679 [Hydra vulgaris]XP_047137012.1 uncharacterized protein LOC124813679 [Hydra vulgaris]XP_047137013.1 uncharacterized protein LOC124813679 [Hydra vulgaris]XP_047137014.1 uncharacterized protein LOC124813679 [Hydra vulgaris]XP_047137015.1 uncharacterized protein LOC124813679 [Hydra vulgaris]